MTQTEWDKYVNGLVSEIREKQLVTQSEIRVFLRENGYRKKARDFIKAYSGDNRVKATYNMSVNQTVKRLSTRAKANTLYLKRRNAEILNGSYAQTIRSVKTLEMELKKRLRSISDPVEYRRTRADFQRLITIKKNIRNATEEKLPKVLQSSLKSMNDIQFSKTIRSSLNAQVKSVAVTEKTRVVSEKFLESVGDDTLIDIVLSPKHIVYDVCDEAVKGNPYTKENVPKLPLHPNSRTRYAIHSKKSVSQNKRNAGAKQ